MPAVGMSEGMSRDVFVVPSEKEKYGMTRELRYVENTKLQKDKLIRIAKCNQNAGKWYMK